MVEQRVNLGDLFAKLSPVFEDHYMNVFEVFEVFEAAVGQGDCQGGWEAFVGGAFDNPRVRGASEVYWPQRWVFERGRRGGC